MINKIRKTLKIPPLKKPAPKAVTEAPYRGKIPLRVFYKKIEKMNISDLDKGILRVLCAFEDAAGMGGFWVSKNGGTANVIAKEIINHFTEVDFFDALTKVQELAGGDDWYLWLTELTPKKKRKSDYIFTVKGLVRQQMKPL